MLLLAWMQTDGEIQVPNPLRELQRHHVYNFNNHVHVEHRNTHHRHQPDHHNHCGPNVRLSTVELRHLQRVPPTQRCRRVLQLFRQ
jgi:hypothetical protein